LQRWRTQRNAIRNANCRIPWVIKSLNAHCASGNPGSMPVWVSVIISHFLLWKKWIMGACQPSSAGTLLKLRALRLGSEPCSSATSGTCTLTCTWERQSSNACLHRSSRI